MIGVVEIPREFRVFAPATVANVGPGFDCFGFSLGEPGDTVTGRLSETPGVRIVEIIGDEGKLPVETERNAAGKAAMAIWNNEPTLASRYGLELTLEKGLPLCSGMGSSAASAVAGAVVAMLAAGTLTGRQYDRQRALEAALAGEAVAAGAPHADNVAPCLLGGFTIVQSNQPLRIARFEPTLKCHIVLVKPDFDLPTKQARELLPAQVPLTDAIANSANASALVLALLTDDADLLRHALTDHIVVPRRAHLIPGFEKAQTAAVDAGAYGCSISGAGPALFAMTPNERTARRVGEAIRGVFAAHNLAADEWISTISSEGAKIR
jgi:homoserine kinase